MSYAKLTENTPAPTRHSIDDEPHPSVPTPPPRTLAPQQMSHDELVRTALTPSPCNSPPSAGPSQPWHKRAIQSPYSRVAYFGVQFAGLMFMGTLFWNFSTTLLPGKLGFIALSIAYGSLSIASPFTVLVIETLGMRTSLAISTVAFALTLGACVLAKPWAILTVAPLFGISLATIYNAQSSYTSRLASKQQIGRVLGVFWAIATFGQTACSFLIGYLTGRGISLRTLFIGFMAWGIVPFVMGLLLPRLPKPTKSEAAQRAAAASGVDATFRAKFMARVRRTGSIFGLLRRRDVLLLVPMMLVCGTFTSLYGARLNPVLGSYYAGMAWSITTIIRVVMTFPVGWLSDIIDHRIITVVAFLSYVGMDACMYFFEAVPKAWLYYLGFVLYATGEVSYWSGVLSPVLSTAFDDVEGVYALHRMSWPIMQLVTLVTSPYLSIHTLLYIHVGLLVAAFTSMYIFCHIRAGKLKKEKAELAMSAIQVRPLLQQTPNLSTPRQSMDITPRQSIDISPRQSMDISPRPSIEVTPPQQTTIEVRS